MSRAQAPVQAPGCEDRRSLAGISVRLAELHAAQDPQAGKQRPAALDFGVVAQDVERPHRLMDLRYVIRVLGECDRPQPDVDCMTACGFPVPPRGVPLELAWYVEVGGRLDV